MCRRISSWVEKFLLQLILIVIIRFTINRSDFDWIIIFCILWPFGCVSFITHFKFGTGWISMYIFYKKTNNIVVCYNVVSSVCISYWHMVLNQSSLHWNDIYPPAPILASTHTHIHAASSTQKIFFIRTCTQVHIHIRTALQWYNAHFNHTSCYSPLFTFCTMNSSRTNYCSD